MWWRQAYGGAQTGLRPRLHHSQAVRSAPDPVHRAGGGARRDGIGVARRPITDFDAYESELEKFVYRSGQLMRPVFEVARQQSAQTRRLCRR